MNKKNACSLQAAILQRYPRTIQSPEAEAARRDAERFESRISDIVQPTGRKGLQI